PPAHSVSHVSPPLSCGRLRLHGQDYYYDSINDFFGRRSKVSGMYTYKWCRDAPPAAACNHRNGTTDYIFVPSSTRTAVVSTENGKAEGGGTMRLDPIEKPNGFITRMAYWGTRRRFGKVMTPMKVVLARMPGSLRFSNAIAKFEMNGIRL